MAKEKPNYPKMLAQKYSLADEIGKGASGIVYKALNMQTGGMVAIKKVALRGESRDQLQLLQREIAVAPTGPALSTVYVGGGTPSLLSVEQLRALLEALRRRYGLAPGAELSLELDPASFDEQRLAGYLAAGVTRVSLGGQSFTDAVLQSLGRRHRRADLLEAADWLQQAQRSGRLQSWSLDLIQGLPGQTLSGWREQL